VDECHTYQCNKGETVIPPSTLQPLSLPPTIWTDISMDFNVVLPKSGNKLVIMVALDRLSKYDHLCSLQQPFKTSKVAQICMDNIFKLHRKPPHSIFSDHDPTFTSNLWKELFRLQETQLHLSTTYHP
jgi:hypothetical protein